MDRCPYTTTFSEKTDSRSLFNRAARRVSSETVSTHGTFEGAPTIESFRSSRSQDMARR